jgi:hypothetical protein
MKEYFCDLCSEKLPSDFDGKVCAERYPKCIDKQLENELADNKKLKESVLGWRDAWYELREIIGNMWWHHKAIDNDEYRAYCQANLDEIAKITPVSYCGFVGMEADWHYKAWMKKRS